MNIEKINVVVPIFGTTGANAREHKALKAEDLKKLVNEGINFDTYQIHEGETLRFPKFEDLEVEWVAVSKGNKKGYHIVKCESELNGRKKWTWFGLPALYKRAKFEGSNDENTPVQPSWYDLGNNLARLEALCKMGEIHGENTITVQVPVFDANGNRVYEDVFDEDGQPVLENGVQKTVAKMKDQKVVIISEYVDPTE